MKNKGKKFLFYLAILLIVAGLVTVYVRQEKKLDEMTKLKKQYEAELRKVEGELAVIKNEADAIDTPEAREKMAREKLGMVKKDEIQYIIRKSND